MLLPLPNHPLQKLAVTVFDVLSALMLTTCSKKGLVMTAKQAP